jgi:pilus assembly protein Flp/PilA
MVRLLTAKYKLVDAAKKFFSKKEEGASMVEYGLLVALIAVVCIGAVTALGVAISGKFQAIVTAL